MRTRRRIHWTDYSAKVDSVRKRSVYSESRFENGDSYYDDIADAWRILQPLYERIKKDGRDDRDLTALATLIKDARDSLWEASNFILGI